MLLTRPSTECFLRVLFLFGLGFQQGWSQIHRRSFCVRITMSDTRLCDGNLPIIEIVEVSQYDFAGDEYPGRPCVYSDIDCGRPVRRNTQLYRDIFAHCDGQRTCGGFYITSLRVCMRRSADYMTIRFRCIRDETATTMASPTSIRASSPTPQDATTPPNSTPTSATTDSLSPPNTTPTSTTTGSPANPPTNSGITDAEEVQTNNTGLYAGVAVGGVVSVILAIVVIAVCVKRKKRHPESKPIDTNHRDTQVAIQTNAGQQSSRLHTPGEKEIALEGIVTDNNANETSPEQPAPGRMAADNPAVSQHESDLAERHSPVGSNPGQGDTSRLATPTADTQEDWGYSSVGAATSEPTPSSKEPKYDQHNKNTAPATIQQPVDANGTIEPDVYATVRKDKPHTSDIENEAPAPGATKEDDYSLATETDVYATVEKDRDEDANELVIVDNPLYE